MLVRRLSEGRYYNSMVGPVQSGSEQTRWCGVPVVVPSHQTHKSAVHGTVGGLSGEKWTWGSVLRQSLGPDNTVGVK